MASRLGLTGVIGALAVAVACGSSGEGDPGLAAADAGSRSPSGTSGGGDAAPPANDARDASTAPVTACLPQSFVDTLTNRFSCEAKALVKATRSELPHDCHSQGIGWHRSDELAVSCMDVGGPSGRLLAYPVRANDSGQWLATDALEVNVDPDTRHPSAFQIGASGAFPIAMARSSEAGPSEIRFFRLAAGKIEGPVGTFRHDASHVGAVAYATLLDGAEPRTVLVGCGWDCATLSVWTAAGADAVEGFTRVHHGPTSALVVPGVDENVGKYNAIHLAPRCEGGAPLLVGSHGDWLDVWSITDLFGAAPRMKKLAKRRISEDVVRHGLRPIFFEGMALEVAGDAVSVWAAPHDFGTDGCPTGTRCAQYVYRCSFAR